MEKNNFAKVAPLVTCLSFLFNYYYNAITTETKISSAAANWNLLGLGLGGGLVGDVELSSLLDPTGDLFGSLGLFDAVVIDFLTLRFLGTALGGASGHRPSGEADLGIGPLDQGPVFHALLLGLLVVPDLFLAFSIAATARRIFKQALGLFGFLGVFASGALALFVLDQGVAGGELFWLLEEATLGRLLIVSRLSVVVAA